MARVSVSTRRTARNAELRRRCFAWDREAPRQRHAADRLEPWEKAILWAGSLPPALLKARLKAGPPAVAATVEPLAAVLAGFCITRARRAEAPAARAPCCIELARCGEASAPYNTGGSARKYVAKNGK